MLDMIGNSVFETGLSSNTVVFCTICSILLGIGVALMYMLKNSYDKGFVITLVLLPAMVQIVIMLVNGNVGTGVAVVGVLSLIRFRSIPGTARDIGSIFLAMTIGLAAGLGYLLYALIFLIIIGLVNLVMVYSKFGVKEQNDQILKITIPENLDYEDLFDDIFIHYVKSNHLEMVRTTNMGSFFELTYQIEMKERNKSKEFLDALRCRNGNLNIILSRPQILKNEL